MHEHNFFGGEVDNMCFGDIKNVFCNITCKYDT